MICSTAGPSSYAYQSETYSFLSVDPSSRTPQLSKASITLMSRAPWRPTAGVTMARQLQGRDLPQVQR
jgi:type 1 glutamine amidotransferase